MISTHKSQVVKSGIRNPAKFFVRRLFTTGVILSHERKLSLIYIPLLNW